MVSRVKTEAELVEAAHRSSIGSFRKLAQHSAGGEFRTVGGVFAFVTGIPTALFNGCVVVERASAADLADALTWVRSRNAPFQVSMTDTLPLSLGGVAVDHGAELDPTPYPGMVLYPITEPPPPARGVSVVRAAEPGLADYLPRSFTADRDVEVFTARLHGRPVGTSIAIRTGDVAGVYGVGTLPTARGRGVGSAATWAAVSAGQRWGCDIVVLQSSAMGLSMYTAMGFRTVVRYTTFSSTFAGR